MSSTIDSLPNVNFRPLFSAYRIYLALWRRVDIDKIPELTVAIYSEDEEALNFFF